MAIKADPQIERRLRACSDAEEFWALLLTVVPQNSRAYLGTLLRQGEVLLRQHRLSLPDARMQRFCTQGSEVDKAKIFDFLLCHPSAATYYEAFLIMQHKADDRAYLYRCCQKLLAEGSDLSCNMAAITSRYFDLQLPAHLAMAIESYQLSRLDEGYEAFRKILLRQ